jgi:hypothetical protein
MDEIQKNMNHDTAGTAEKQINHGEHGGHGERQSKVLFLSVSSVVNAFDLRRPTGISVGHTRLVAVVKRF